MNNNKKRNIIVMIMFALTLWGVSVIGVAMSTMY